MAEEPYIDLLTGKPVEQWVADAMARPSKRAQAEDITRPIIGIENRTAQEVFDIMCDRISSAARHRTEAVKPLVEALEKASRLIKLQADCLEGYAESSGHKATPVPSVFHFQATHFRDIATDLDAALRSVQS